IPSVVLRDISGRRCEERKRRSNPPFRMLSYGLLRFRLRSSSYGGQVARNDEPKCSRGAICARVMNRFVSLENQGMTGANQAIDRPRRANQFGSGAGGLIADRVTPAS